MRIAIIAPHPDDETIGCAGTLLKHLARGDEVHWILMTEMKKDCGYTKDAIIEKKRVIDSVFKAYPFSGYHPLGFAATQLDQIPLSTLNQTLAQTLEPLQPDVLYLPYPGDVHSDHRITFEAAMGITKWFRFPSIEKILCYETLSETDYGIHPNYEPFRPNLFVNIEKHWKEKLAITGLYQNELGEFPFPRSIETITALATLRGSQAGCKYAESFMILKEIEHY